MALFKYIAIDANGERIKGVLEAEDTHSATAKLHQRDCIPLDISAQKGGTLKEGLLQQLQRKTVLRFRQAAKFRITFTQNLATMLTAGLPMDRALSALEVSTERPEQKRLVSDIRTQVRGGKDLSEALASHSKIFNDLYVNLVRAGESGGLLAIVLDRLGLYLADMQEVREKIGSALIYPLILLTIVVISVIILFFFVMPRFSVIFEDLGAAVPPSTQLILGTSQFCRDQWPLLLAALIGALIAAVGWIRSARGVQQLNRLSLKLPLVNTLITNMDIARYSRTLGELQRNGVELIRGMDLALNTIRNRIIRNTIRHARERVKEGGQLASALRESGYFAPIVLQMLTVGEESGRLDEMLIRVADQQDQLVYRHLERVMGILGPLLILGMAIIVGFIVISMLQAIFSINDFSF